MNRVSACACRSAHKFVCSLRYCTACAAQPGLGKLRLQFWRHLLFATESFQANNVVPACMPPSSRCYLLAVLCATDMGVWEDVDR
jgi:hypothetical protein